jgi:hypothetical protein
MINVSYEKLNSISRAKAILLKRILNSEIDQIELAASVTDLYAAAGCEPPRRILIAQGPKDAFTNRESLQKTFKQSVNLNGILNKFSCSLAHSCKEKYKAYFEEEGQIELRNMIFWDLNFQVSAAMASQIETILTREHIWKGVSVHPGFSDWDWIGFYRTISESFDLDFEIPIFYPRLLDSGLFALIAESDFAIVIPRPEAIERNDNLVLHAEDAPAISWADGTSLYFWNGVAVPEKLILCPDDILAEDILGETNAEVRRCYQEKLGSERFGHLLGLIELDRNTDRFGHEQVLYRTRSKDKVVGDFIYFAKVVCPSTGRNYFLCVPPGMKTVEEAVAWTFGKRASEYRPSIET